MKLSSLLNELESTWNEIVELKLDLQRKEARYSTLNNAVLAYVREHGPVRCGDTVFVCRDERVETIENVRSAYDRNFEDIEVPDLAEADE